jgi:hypothetical protein
VTLCGYGGFCTRAPGHKGTHTASPPPSTRNWDHDREEAERRHIETAVTLLLLDWPTPEVP